MTIDSGDCHHMRTAVNLEAPGQTSRQGGHRQRTGSVSPVKSSEDIDMWSTSRETVTRSEESKTVEDDRGPCPSTLKADSVDKSFGKVDMLTFCRILLHVTKNFFSGSQKWKAWSMLAALLFMAVIHTGLHVIISYARRDFTNALTDRNSSDFQQISIQFAVIILVASALFGAFNYLQNRMALEWRSFLTNQILSKYFSNRTYFKLQMNGDLDNPDQRICEDVSNFCTSIVTVIKVVAQKFLRIFAFSAVLWSISPTLVWFLLAYAFLGTFIILRLFARKMMQIKFEGLQKEADLRYSLIRIRDNAESIAFYCGEQSEKASVVQFFGKVISNTAWRLDWQFFVDFFNHGYEHATHILPGLLLAPQVFSGELKYGDVVQTSMAFHEIFQAITVFVLNFDLLSTLAAETERLEGLLNALELSASVEPTESEVPLRSQRGWGCVAALNKWLGSVCRMRFSNMNFELSSLGGKERQYGLDEEESSTPILPKSKPSNADASQGDKHFGQGLDLVENMPCSPTQTDPATENILQCEAGILHCTGQNLLVEKLEIQLPGSGEVLFRNGLSFGLEPEQSLLIMGPSGCGKSSLLRVISGLWNSGQGCVVTPASEDSFFLPQKPYMPLGSLREQLLFPKSTKAVDDKELLHLLQQVSLSSLTLRYSRCLDEERDWAATLSTGEQQRVAFARLFLHQPKIAFLDEATSAVDVATEEKLYHFLAKSVSTYVSVGHRLTLVPFHTSVLYYDSSREQWICMPSKAFLEQRKFDLS